MGFYTVLNPQSPRRFAPGFPTETGPPARRFPAGTACGRCRAIRCRVTISIYFLLLVACALVLDRTGDIFLVLLCAAVHEAGHLVSLRLMGVRAEEVSFRLFGVELRLAGGTVLGYRREILLDLSGGAANLLLAAGAFFFCRAGVFPRQTGAITAFSLLLGVFNLLPIGPLDGGRALEAALCRRLSCNAAANAVTAVSAALLLPLATAGLLLLRNAPHNPSLLVVCVYLGVSLAAKPQCLHKGR